MRCRACDTMLSDYESSIRSVESNEFIDMCVGCMQQGGDTNVIGNTSLKHEAEEYPEELDFQNINDLFYGADITVDDH